jgi:hypothetical protein
MHRRSEMRHRNRWLVVSLIIAGSASLTLTGCGDQTTTHHKIEPAHVEHVEGEHVARVTLTERAMERLDIQMGTVGRASAAMIRRVAEGGGFEDSAATQKNVVPYSAIIYDQHGDTWIYTSPAPREFVRHHIEVDYIEGDVAVLSEGPPLGTKVATVGAAELYGTEFEVGH